MSRRGARAQGPAGAPATVSAELPLSAASARIAREMAAHLTGQLDNTTLGLVVSELVTNAVMHARVAPRLTLSWDGRCVRIEVSDDGPGRPVLRRPAPTATSGRGVALVDSLAEHWGVVPGRGGKTVWAEVRVLPAAG